MIQVLSNRREKNGEAEFFLESCYYPVNDNWIIVDMYREKVSLQFMELGSQFELTLKRYVFYIVICALFS